MYWVLKTLFGWLIRLIWVKNVAGLENIPKKGAFIIAANHCSYFDFLSLVAVLPRKVHFLAAEKFYKSKFWYPLVAWTGQIKVDRKSQDKEEVYKEVFKVLQSGEVVGIFPEGTRSADGKIGKTYTGVAKFAITAKVPVVPVGIKGTYEILSRHQKWPKIKKSISIKIGNVVSLNDYYSSKDDSIVLRQVADDVVEKIKELAK